MFRPWIFIWFSVVFAPISLATSSNSTADQIPVPSLNSLSEVIQVISAAQDWNSEEVVVSNIDTAGAKVGKTQSYELEVQVGEKVFPARFVDELTSSRYSGGKETAVDGENSFGGLMEAANLAAEAVLLPFQMEGPLEVWIEEANNLQLVMPDNNNIGGLKHLILAEGVVVTVEGAREVSLAYPVDFPSSLNTSFPVSGPGSNLWALSLSLRHAMQLEGRHLVALRIVGPTLMVAAALGNQETAESNVEAKFFAPGALELFTNRTESNSPSPIGKLTDQQTWPLPSLYSSDLKLLFLEKLLIKYLGNRAYREGSFRIIRASATASVFVKIQLELKKKISNDSFDSDLWPAWRTRPTVQRLHFEVLARVEGKKLKPILIKRLKPFVKVETYSWSALMSNVSFTSFPSVLIPCSPLTLDVQW
jgi:hypothetical protein